MVYVYTTKKGDTLNKIANQFGFRNYRDAGITSVQSGNFDRIGVGEQITLNNYDPSKVQTSGAPTPPVISSRDNAQAFNDNKAKLDKILAGNKDTGEVDADTQRDNSTKLSDAEKTLSNKTKPDTGDQLGTDIIDDPLYTKSRADDRAKQQQAEEEAESEKEDYLSTINTRLADIDANAAASIARIRATAEKRLKEQRRINQININRVKAYGVGESGIYKPLQFSDAITNRETEAADKINELERLRDSAIAEAEAAARKGKSDLLSEKMDALNEIEDRMRDKLNEIEDESDKQYDLLRKLRKEKEDERLKKVEEVQKRLAAFIKLHRDEYENLTPEEMEAKVVEVMKLSNLSYSEAYNAIQDGVQASFDDKKTAAEIAKIEADTERIKATTTKEYAAAAKTRKETEKIDEEGGDGDFTTSQKQKLENAGLGDADRKQKLDFLHGEAAGDATVYSEEDYARTADIGDIVVIAGKRYKKIGADDYEPVE